MTSKSKPGEGIIIVADVGPNVRGSVEATFYSQTQSCMVNILQRKIFADKCRDMVGIVLFGTDSTQNKLATLNQYQHITVLQQPKFVDWDLIKEVERLPQGNASGGDWLDAVVVAMDLLQDPEGIMADPKKIVLMTDFNGEFSDDKVETIIEGLQDMNIELSVIGPCLCDEEDDEVDDDHFDFNSSAPSSSNGALVVQKSRKGVPLNWNGKPKSPQQLAAEILIKRITAQAGGIICSFDEAIPQLIFFEKKSQGSANWNAMMDIGPNLKIPIVGKIKVKLGTLHSWKKVCLEDETSLILSETSFHLDDADRSAVGEEDVVSGFRYGTTLVPFGDEDLKLKYSCEAPSATLNVIGVTSTDNVPLTIRTGDQVLVVTAKDNDEEGRIAISAIIQALKQLNMVAITRRVYRKNLNPVLGVLFPDISKECECFVWVALPFQEDVREFSFPSLEKSMMKITDQQKEAVDQLITGMELNIESDEEDFDPALLVNPQMQHYFNCFTQRGLDPSEPLPSPRQHILDVLSAFPHHREKRDALTPQLKELFPTKKIENYKQKKEYIFFKGKSESASHSISDVASSSSLTSGDVINADVRKISTATPVADFYAMLRAELPRYTEICSEMSNVLLEMTESVDDDASSDRILYEKVVSAVKAFRAEAVAIVPTPFNHFIRQLKQIVIGKSPQHLWLVISQENLGLITRLESLKSDVTSDEAGEFLDLEEANAEVNPPPPAQEQPDYDDMFDEL